MYRDGSAIASMLAECQQALDRVEPADLAAVAAAGALVIDMRPVQLRLRDGELPVFWACGVTPQTALMDAKLPIAIAHTPGHMLMTDITNASLAVF